MTRVAQRPVPAPPVRPRPRRRPVALTLLVLLLALGAALAALVPWTVLPGADLQADVAGQFTAAQIAREVAFHDALRPPAYGALALGLVVSALLGLTPLGAWLVHALARPLRGWWVAQVVLGTLAVTVVLSLVTLPLAVRVEQVSRQYGLSTASWGSWLADRARGVGVSAALAALVLLVLIGLARRLPRTWWAWGAGATAVLVFAGSFAYPLLVEPVFNRFTPLAPGAQRSALLALAERDGVPVDGVLVADASRRTTALNAYVSGFGSSRRIVVYDTLLREASPAEVELVVAHELGHAKERDVLTGSLYGALGGAAVVCLLALLVGTAPVRRRSGASGMADPRIVPFLLLLASAGTLVLAPATNLLSRRVEARADVHALNLTRDPQTFLAVQRRLSLANLSDLEPNPVAYALFATHPGPAERIALALAWARQHPDATPLR